jgi:hypothetical protein
VKNMVSQATKINRLELGQQWLDSSDAARAIGVNPKQLTTTLRPMLTHQSRSMAGKGARYVGYAYAVHDIARVAAITQALACAPLEATRILWAIRRLGHLGILAMIEKQLNLLELEDDKPRRRSSPTRKRARL